MRAVKNETGLKTVIITTGISSVVTQLFTIREFLVQFTGNEYVIAVIFFNWLIAGGLGTLLAQTAARHPENASVGRLGQLSLGAVILPALQIILIRRLREVFFASGVAVGFYPTLIFIAVLTAPYCILIGFLLPYTLQLLRVHQPDYPGPRLYLWDNLGDTAGGALFSFVLVLWATPLQALGMIQLLLLAAISRLLYRHHRLTRPWLMTVLAAAAFLLLTVWLETATLTIPRGKLAAYQESRYGRLLVARDQNQHTLFFNGRPLTSSHNLQTAEETAHYALAQTDHPRRILLISATAGLIREIDKHRPETIDYIEINPQITAALFRFGLLQSPDNLNVIHADARHQLLSSNRTYDAIIMSLPEPATFQLNRFYTERFFQLIQARLTPEGVFSLRLPAVNNYLAEPERRQLATVYHTLRRHFQHVTPLPGGHTYFISADTAITTEIPRRLSQKNITTRYLAHYYHGDLSPARIRWLQDQIQTPAPLNTDLQPALMRLVLAGWFSQFAESPGWFYLLLGAGLVVYLAWLNRGQFILFSTGFTLMGAETFTIFAFQIFFGYIYYQIGLLVTVFLAGLLPGAWFGQQIKGPLQKMSRLLDTGLIVLLGLFIGALALAGQQLPPSAYLFFGLTMSCLCGFQFAVVLNWSGDTTAEATRAFSTDLIGAALGALVTSMILIPYLGLIQTALVLILLKCFSLLRTGGGHVQNQPA